MTSWSQVTQATRSVVCYLNLVERRLSNLHEKTEIINIETRIRRYGGDLKHARAYFRMVTVHDPVPRLLAFGGSAFGGSRDEVEEFSEDTATWRVVDKMQDKRSNFGIVAVPKDLVCN